MTVKLISNVEVESWIFAEIEFAKYFYKYVRGLYVMKYEPYLLKDVHDASAQNKFNVISTFAGGGGSSTGYIVLLVVMYFV